MIIRNAEIGDLKDVFSWRNDSLSCSMFFNNEGVSIEDHEVWFKTSLLSPSRFLYIGCISEKKIGICRFDFDIIENKAEISINLNPQMRGKRLSLKFLSNAIEKFREINNCKLFAIIKKENEGSIRIFQKCNFLKTKEINNFYLFEKFH